MRRCKFILILPVLCWALVVHAQEPESFGSMPEQWQMSLDGIKSKAQTLMVENNGLQVEYRQLIEQLQELQQSVSDQQNKNEQIKLSLNDKHSKVAQQARVEELSKIIRSKKQEVRALEDQGGYWKRKLESLETKNQQLKEKVSQKGLIQPPSDQQQAQNTDQSQSDDQLDQLRLQLEDQKKKEALMEDELENLKAGGNSSNSSQETIEAQNKDLEARLDVLLLQKLQHERSDVSAGQEQDNGRVLDQLKKHKEKLEAKIQDYEMRMDSLRENSLQTFSWSMKKKKLVHEMVLVDARNNKMRGIIKVLREDIDVLREQVARLERRVDFVKGQS